MPLIGLASFVCIFLGLIKPSIFNKLSKNPMTRKRAVAIFGGTFIGSMIIIGIVAPPPPAQEKQITVADDAVVVKSPSATDNALTDNTSAPVEDVQPAIEQTAPVAAPVVEETKTPLSVLDQLWTAADVSIKTREGIDIQYLSDDDGNTALLTHQIDDYWDENAIVRQAYSDLVAFGQEVFKIDGVTDVDVIIRVMLTDKYGNSEYGNAVVIDMKKEEFMKYNWEALRGTPISERMKSSASIYIILPGIASELNPDKLYLSSY